MKHVVIDPAIIKAFGPSQDAHFCLITNSSISGQLEIVENGKYLSYKKIMFDTNHPFESILSQQVPECAHILVVSPDVFYSSPPQKLVGAKRKLLAMACNSTPTDIDAIQHFMNIIYDTDPEKQQLAANRFFELGEQAAYLEFVDEENQTSARFNHTHDSYLWNEQAGIVNYGEQQIVPSGEISVLPLQISDFNETLRLDFNGTIALNGTAILHSGNTPHCFTRTDQRRLHSLLDYLSKDAVIAEVEGGRVDKLHAKSARSAAACNILQNMFDIDSRYRLLWEIGFGINTSHKILTGNHAMNETYGNTSGAIHFGLGLTPWTQYHLEIICPKTTVLTDQGDCLINNKINPKKAGLNRQKAIGCGCNV